METLIRILAEDILTFAYCEDDQVDPDFACSQLERIAHALQTSDQETVRLFTSTVREMADEARQEGLTERAQQLDEMPSHLGLK